jgi:hypothetical protein
VAVVDIEAYTYPVPADDIHSEVVVAAADQTLLVVVHFHHGQEKNTVPAVVHSY